MPRLPVLTILEPRWLWVEVVIPVSCDFGIREGQQLTVVDRNASRRQTARVEEIAPSADPKTHTLLIPLYEDHDTHEQFHSEYKTYLDLERLPSGKFATNDLILSLAMLAYYVLRLIGQSALLSEDAPVRHPAKRRRLKTVMQEMITVSAKLVQHARQTCLNFGRHRPAFVVFNRLYGAWSTA